jgi:D-tyrosyl-tRNA(Tyr) deacylase
VRVVVQRVSRAEVRVGGRVTGRIGPGFLLLVGIRRDDDDETLRWMADKILSLRLFSDDEGKMNRAIEDVRGGLLVVSQFTLYGDVRKGRRPSFTQAAKPETGKRLYERFCDEFERLGMRCERGVFGAHMDVELVNDGPVTLWIDTAELERPRRG